MHSISGVKAAKQIANRGLKGLRGFASIFKIDIRGVEVGVESESGPGLADSGDLQYGLPDLFDVIGEAAGSVHKEWPAAPSFGYYCLEPVRESSESNQG